MPSLTIAVTFALLKRTPIIPFRRRDDFPRVDWKHRAMNGPPVAERWFEGGSLASPRIADLAPSALTRLTNAS